MKSEKRFQLLSQKQIKKLLPGLFTEDNAIKKKKL